MGTDWRCQADGVFTHCGDSGGGTRNGLWRMLRSVCDLLVVKLQERRLRGSGLQLPDPAGLRPLLLSGVIGVLAVAGPVSHQPSSR